MRQRLRWRLPLGRSDHPTDVIHYALGIVWPGQVGTALAKLSRFLGGGLDVSSERYFDAIAMLLGVSPQPKLKRIERTRGLGITKDGTHRHGGVLDHRNGLVCRGGFDHDVATAAEVIGDGMAHEDVVIDD